jgi:transposase
VNVLKPYLENSVITLLNKGFQQREINRKTGVDRKTIRKIRGQLAAAAAAGANSSTPATGSGPPSAAENPPPWPPAVTAVGVPIALSLVAAKVRSACEGHREWIEAQVRLGRNAMAIYQELVDTRGFTFAYNSVKRFCRGLRQREPEQFDRLEFPPGEESQVDYGEGALTLHPKSGKYRRPRLFIMTLRYSRRSFRKTVWKSSSEAWARLHEEAFHYFKGSTCYVVLDNLKEGVIKPDLYEPEINRLYGAVLAHYGVIADPARIRDPDRKGTVESAIQHTQSTALKGKRFASIEEQNAYLMHWEEKWAAPRIHGRAKRQVEEMYQAERPHLRPLPLVAFQYFSESTRTVWDDTTIQVDSSWYAAGPARIGTQVLARLYATELEIRDLTTLKLLRRHPRAYRKGEVQLPDAERVFNPSRQTHRILDLAHAIGPKTHTLCLALFDQRGREAQKTMWGIVGLGRRFPARILEQAVETAVIREHRSAKAIRAIAEELLQVALAQLQEQPTPTTASLTQQHELIRAPSLYAEFFNDNIRR